MSRFGAKMPIASSYMRPFSVVTLLKSCSTSSCRIESENGTKPKVQNEATVSLATKFDNVIRH